MKKWFSLQRHGLFLNVNEVAVTRYNRLVFARYLKKLIVLLGLVSGALLSVNLQRCGTPGPADRETGSTVGGSLDTPRYMGSVSCRSCHEKEFADWTSSDHFHAMATAGDSTVLGDFSGVTLTADGVTSRFFRKGDAYFINTEGDDGANHDYKVLYTFGYFPLQQYLVAFPGGRMQATRASWDVRSHRWFHQYAGQKIHHRDWLHWTGAGQNWNTMCASCHSTNLQKNYQVAADTFHTTWSEINVSCESCHGPGSRHIDFIQSEAYRSGEKLERSGLDYARDTLTDVQLATCAPCHARKSDISGFGESAALLDRLIPQVLSTEYYFADGQIREEDYEYGSFTQSKMYQHNVHCSNCHNPHSGKTVLQGNLLCLQCHQPKYDSPEHHFHAAGTDGAQCINCHMPQRTYMGIDHRRDHSFRVPRPDQSEVYGTPDACTQCHRGKQPAWAAAAIRERYGTVRRSHYSDDLLPGSRMDAASESHLVRLAGDTLQPGIVRATAAGYMGNLPTPGTARALLNGLKDHHALIRYQSLRALESFPQEVWLQAAVPLLNDPVRAVRIAAADLCRRLPAASIPENARLTYSAADAENRKWLLDQTDFSVGNVMMGDYELQGGSSAGAIQYYERGLKKDSLMNYARLNLSAAYSGAGKNDEALRVLNDAAAIDPGNDRIYYNRALLLYELGRAADAETDFRKAIGLHSSITGVYYNYGLLLQQDGRRKEAEEVLLKGYALAPDAANINYALAYLYLSTGRGEKARRHAELLRNTDPANPQYQQIFLGLGMK
jgi:tetratricopeptide (TPR) repeat protein